MRVAAFMVMIVALFQSRTCAAEPASKDKDGFYVHSLISPNQKGTTEVRVLVPDKPDKAKRFSVVYVLPVEALREQKYGDGLAEILKHDLHNQYQVICVAPTFSHLPWYADHPKYENIRQESYLLHDVLPLIEKHYPVSTEAADRWLLGFSKSGWGAWSLLLRHPRVFGAAVAWDAPLLMTKPDRYGSGEIFSTQENFEKYRISKLLEEKQEALLSESRLCLLGYCNFRQHHQDIHALLEKCRIAHEYHDVEKKPHTWHSGWVADGMKWLAERKKGS